MAAGRVATLVIQTFYWIGKGRVDGKNTIALMIEFGYNSFPVIALTSLFTGMVLALQTGASSKNIFNTFLRRLLQKRWALMTSPVAKGPLMNIPDFPEADDWIKAMQYTDLKPWG